jgi:hypothetical protein
MINPAIVTNQAQITQPVSSGATSVEPAVSKVSTDVIVNPVTPSILTVPITVPSVNITINTPDPTIIEPPPVRKIPPIIPLFQDLPGISGGGGYAKHGLHSVYTYTPFEIPEMYVALPDIIGLKPDALSTKLFGKLLRSPQGVDLLGEENFEDTPFGRKSIRTVVAKARLKGGATEGNPSSISRMTSVEDFNAPVLKKKVGISKSTGKKQTYYEVASSPKSLGDMGL